MNDDDMWWMAFNWRPGEIINNWNPWCNSNALQCFLLMENNKDKLVKAVYRSMKSVDKFINFVKSDGLVKKEHPTGDTQPVNFMIIFRFFLTVRVANILVSGTDDSPNG